MERIKNCPFCGGEGKLKDVATPYRHGWVGCPTCKVYMDWKIAPKYAVEKWNRRAYVETTAQD